MRCDAIEQQQNRGRLAKLVVCNARFLLSIAAFHVSFCMGWLSCAKFFPTIQTGVDAFVVDPSLLQLKKQVAILRHLGGFLRFVANQRMHSSFSSMSTIYRDVWIPGLEERQAISPFRSKVTLLMASSSSSSNRQGFLEKDELVEKQATISERLVESSSSSMPSNTTIKDVNQFLKHQQETFDDMAEFFANQQTIPPDLIPVYQILASKVVQLLINERQVRSSNRQSNDDDNNNKSTPDVDVGIILERPFRLLDVGCGTGALWPFLLEQATLRNITLQIQGIDLSPRMVHHAQDHAQTLLQSPQYEHERHDIQVTISDILNYNPHMSSQGLDNALNESDSDNDQQKGQDKNATTPEIDASSSFLFDAIVCNACWGNFYDRYLVLQHLAKLLQVQNSNKAAEPFGKLFVTHPLGAEFVQQLHESDPRTVPNLLPPQWSFQDLIGIPVEVEEFIQKVDIDVSSSSSSSSSLSPAKVVETDDSDKNDTETSKNVPFYFCAFRRVRHVLLPRVWRLCGPVASGYGRGGKKLGFPTANLAASQFLQNALKDLDTGVYVGWAQVEMDDDDNITDGMYTVHKAVVNVGYSPTFEGQTNKEKIIEAHLMPEKTLSLSSTSSSQQHSSSLSPLLKDFYGQPMRLELLAYLRPEQKFASFPALIEQIQADAQDAKDLLDCHPVLAHGRNDAFFVMDGRRRRPLSNGDNLQSGKGDDDDDNDEWIWNNKNKNNNSSRWACQDMKDYLEAIES